MAISLATSEQAQNSGPEELFISALIESGSYDPRRYNVNDAAIHAHRTVHEFCLAYQSKADDAPPAHLVEEKFPNFNFISGISPTWAAGEVNKAQANRELRKSLSKISNAIALHSHGEAISHMTDAIRSYKTENTQGVDALDFSLLDLHTASQTCPVPDGYLSKLTGGHPASELWLIAALWGCGKSWKLIEHAVTALEHGWDVKFFSLEMSPADILKRLHQVALRNHVTTASLLPDHERRDALVGWYDTCGDLKVFGPSHGRVDASVISASVENEKTLVVVDYVGRMYSVSGSPATEDYKSVAAISRELCEVAGMLNIPVLAAAQLNRSGQLAGSMELERDPHVIVEMSRLSEACDSVRKNTIKKSRNTSSGGSWFTLFDPVNGRFPDITPDEALERKLTEEASVI
jgi:hypothetical protein